MIAVGLAIGIVYQTDTVSGHTGKLFYSARSNFDSKPGRTLDNGLARIMHFLCLFFAYANILSRYAKTLLESFESKLSFQRIPLPSRTAQLGKRTLFKFVLRTKQIIRNSNKIICENYESSEI